MTPEKQKEYYRSLCTDGRITDLFMQDWWLDATGPWRVSLAVRNQQVIGAMPFRTHRQWGIRKIDMPDLTHHLSIWMDKPPDITEHKWLTREKQIIWMLIEGLPNYDFFSMVFKENSFSNWLPFYWRGFRQESRYSFVLDHADAAVIDMAINSSFKKKLRKASESLQIRTDIDNTSFYRVWSKTYDRKKIKAPFSFEVFQRMDRAIEAHGAGLKMGCYTSDGKLVAVSSLVWDQHTAYYYLSADDALGRDLSASLFLCREAIRIAFEERKVQRFDFCGSMIEGVTEVRRQFGARAVGMMKIYRAKWKWLDVLYMLSR